MLLLGGILLKSYVFHGWLYGRRSCLPNRRSIDKDLKEGKGNVRVCEVTEGLGGWRHGTNGKGV